ncbi:uncharacterized protein [Branchiostoma lanceolatum]|uniref:uncharacterized protein n=1 Tax=Branchiostoma lanceolatum TaxID=7740 RepID=UPI003452EEEB
MMMKTMFGLRLLVTIATISLPSGLALKCYICNEVASREACMRSKLTDCRADQTACMTTYSKNIAGEFWDSACIAQDKCDRFVQQYADHCPKHDESICVSCCNKTGCMGKGAAVTANASARGTMMATAVLAVLNHFVLF